MPFKHLFRSKKPPQPSPPSQSGPAPPQRAHPNDHVSLAEPFLAEGDKYFDGQQYERAITMYNTAVSKDDQNPLLYMKLAAAFSYLQPPQTEDALRNINQAISLNPALGHAWKVKGDIETSKEDDASAVESYENAIGMLQGHEKFAAQSSRASARARLSATNARPSTNLTQTPVPSSGLGESDLYMSFRTIPVSPNSPPRSAEVNTYQSNAVSNTTTSAPAVTTPLPATPLSENARPTATPVATINTSSSSTTPPVVTRQPSSSVSETARPLSSITQVPDTAERSHTYVPISLPPTTATLRVPPATPDQARTATPIPTIQRNTTAEDIANNIPNLAEPPPAYTLHPLQSIAQSTLRSAGGQSQRIQTMKDSLIRASQGSLYLQPYTAAGNIGSVLLMFQGKTYIQSVLQDLGPEPRVHPFLKKYYVDRIQYPGNTFLDRNCEVAASHDGLYTGTVSFLGYAEEYRGCQRLQQPNVQNLREAQTCPPVSTTQALIQRIRTLRIAPMLEDNNGLASLLGTFAFEYVFDPSRQTQIEDICMAYHRGRSAAPIRFIDLSRQTHFSTHLFTTAQINRSIGLQGFLLHIVLGAELLIRLLREPITTNYATIMSDGTSAMIVLAQQWMDNVTVIERPGPSTAPQYLLGPINHGNHIEALLSCANDMQWPLALMDQARQFSRAAYERLLQNPANISDGFKDWLYGLVLPGTWFRMLVMNLLLEASGLLSSLGSVTTAEQGVVVKGKSYWPKRSVLGRVLGACPNVRSVCGWIGPLPESLGIADGCYNVTARGVNYVVPANNTQPDNAADALGFTDAEIAANPQGFLTEVLDMNRWRPPVSLPPRQGSSEVRLAAVRLNEMESAASAPGTRTPQRQYRAYLDFTINGVTKTVTLYTNPVFVHAPPCIGSTHPIHARMVRNHFNSCVRASTLKDNSFSAPATNTLIIIDATKPGEEVLARAWCAENGRHAVVRKNNTCCFTCATKFASSRTGIGCNVLIWCS